MIDLGIGVKTLVHLRTAAMMVPYILAAAATQAFSPVAGHAQNTRLQNTRVLRGGQAQASAGMSEAALAGLEPSEVQLATWLASDGGQSHLLTGWEEAAVEDKRRLLAQVPEMDVLQLGLGLGGAYGQPSNSDTQ